MSDFTAKDVQRLRQETGAGMMDAKKALTEAAGDFDAARKLLRERGLAKAAGREERDSSEGVVAVGRSASAASLVSVRCETDFVAKSDQFTALAARIAEAVASDGPRAADAFSSAVDDLKVTLKENISVGEVVHVPVESGQIVDTYLHIQEGRGVNGVVVVLDGGSEELAHDIAIHIAFARPSHLTRDEVPESEVEEERATLEAITRKEGKPEAALGKIVDGKLSGWFRERVLLEQKYVRDEKLTIEALLGGAQVVRFEQVVIGA